MSKPTEEICRVVWLLNFDCYQGILTQHSSSPIPAVQGSARKGAMRGTSCSKDAAFSKLMVSS
jgi:hypothetical protein